MKVPTIDLQAQFAAVEPAVRAAIDRVLRSQHFIGGPEVEALEQRAVDLTGTRAAVGVSSGTDALLCALMAADIGPGDEVITTPFSFFATVGCILRVGATPVFADIDPVTFNIDADAVAAKITARTRAVLVVHLFGQCCDMTPITRLARRHRLLVVEDAAQALGAMHSDQPAGSLGDVGCFSFFPSKNLGACGDAGLIVTRDEEFGRRCRQLRSHGAAPKYHHPLVGGNFRLDALQAAILNAKWDHLDRWNRARQDNAARYDTLLAGSTVTPPVIAAGNQHIFHQYVVRVPDRTHVQQVLRANGVATAVYYPEPLHLQPPLADLGWQVGDCPHAEQAAEEALALPIYPELTAAQQDLVVDQLRAGVDASPPVPA